jgi:hypothetical protein
MPAITYAADVAPGTQTKVRSRYADAARELTALGFQELCFYSERLRPYSLLLNFPMIMFMKMSGEVLSSHPRLQVGASYLLFRHSTPPTVALPMGMGVKLYTGFDDGTLLVTTSFTSMTVPDESRPVHKSGGKLTVAEAWQLHRERAEHAVKIGKRVQPGDSFEAFVDFSRREEGDAASSSAPGA